MNINRDYIIELVGLDTKYNKRLEIVQERPIQFYKDDRNQTIFIIFHGLMEGLRLRMAIKCPDKHIQEIYPTLLGMEGQDTILQVKLTDILAPGKYDFQMFLESENGSILSSNVSAFKVLTCL